MKYAILLGDGMADYPLEVLGGKTPLEFARTPHMDRIAGEGTLGLIDTIPRGFAPGSDVATLSVLGYDPIGMLLRTRTSRSGEHGHSARG